MFYRFIGYLSLTDFLYTANEMTAVSASVIQNAFHTPFAPINLLNTNAHGIMIIRYLHNDMISDSLPLLSASRAPQEVTDTADTMNPPLMIRRAVSPILTVSALLVNIDIILFGITRHRTVPTAIMTAIIIRT